MSLTLSRYITLENILKHTISKLYVQVIMSSKMKLRDLHYTSDKNQSDSKLCQKAIILKVLEKIIYINYKLQSCSNFGNLMLLLYSNIDI